MRVTENTNYDVVRSSIHRSKGRMEQLQAQSSTMKRINTPSDDPIAAAKLLEIRTEKVNLDQFNSNAKFALTMLENADQAIGSLADIIVRAKELAMNQSSSPSASEASRIGVAEEVEQLRNQSIAIGNRRMGDRFLFGGYKTHMPPVDDSGVYHGDRGEIRIEIAKDVSVPINIIGIEAFNTVPLSSPDFRRSLSSEEQQQEGESVSATMNNVNVFDELESFRVSLLTGDIEGVRNTLDRFDDLHQTLLSLRSRIGSRIQGIEAASLSNEKSQITSASLSSNLEDADMADVASRLAQEEVVFRSALASAKKLIQPSLLDFLR